ncbi:MAG: hypothetical protein IPL39_14970 [Opitutaceae bacterium]|nr:hypothetical protein [Opitutaceae bacterium]
MRKLLNNPWFVAVLALVALGGVAWPVLFPETSYPAPVAHGEPAVVDESAPETSAEGEAPSRLSVAAALKALVIPSTVRDPFALPPKPVVLRPVAVGTAVEVVERLRLSAVWVQGAAVYLLLNGRICQPGDAVERFTVETAAVEGAWIRHAGARSFLPVGQEWVVTTSAPGPQLPLSP